MEKANIKPNSTANHITTAGSMDKNWDLKERAQPTEAPGPGAWCGPAPSITPSFQPQLRRGGEDRVSLEVGIEAERQ